MFTIFIISRSILEFVYVFEHDVPPAMFDLWLLCIIYGLSMTTLSHKHTGSIRTARETS